MAKTSNIFPSLPCEGFSDGGSDPRKLDKNQLYVNLSEMDDADYKVSEEDKRLNRQSYGT